MATIFFSCTLCLQLLLELSILRTHMLELLSERALLRLLVIDRRLKLEHLLLVLLHKLGVLDLLFAVSKD